MQARCHLLNERILAADQLIDDARQAHSLAERLYQDADLLCKICRQPMGMHPDEIQILTCTHIFHQRFVVRHSRKKKRGRARKFSILCFSVDCRCVLEILERWTYQAQKCPICQKNVLFSPSYIALSCS